MIENTLNLFNQTETLEGGALQSEGSQFNKKLLPLSLKGNYGLDENDLNFCNEKLNRQKEFLTSNFYTSFQTGSIKSFLELSHSANFSIKYYAGLVNRCNVINSFIFDDNNLMPVFLTITLNGCFRKALEGDFSTFTQKDKKCFDYSLSYKFENNISFTIKDLINFLNRQWNLFILRIHRKYKGINKYYIRCFEPHKKDGVPHIHALLYIPRYAFDYIFKTYKDIFNAPQNLKQGNKLTQEQVLNGEINGFQWSLNNPTGYIMKYIYKTFINFNKRQDLDFLSAWYVKYKVRRFLSSKMPVPLWIYKKVNFFKKDLYHLCKLIDNPDYLIEWSFEKDYFIFFSDDEEIEYNQGYLTYKYKGRLLYEYKKEIQKSIKHYYSYSFKNKNDVYKINLGLLKNPKPIKDYDLMTLINSENFKYSNCKKIAYYRNLAFERGLIAEKLDINNVDDLELVEKAYKY
ncbi:replication endonuclease, partial [Campylobacter jejuni]|nr:replication endonuclease [Campylobacter jejuni]